VDTIAAIDEEIKATGFPVIPYRGRRSKAELDLEKHITYVKERYGHPIRVHRRELAKAKEMGKEREFIAAMDEWHTECSRRTQDTDFEAQQEDKGEEAE